MNHTERSKLNVVDALIEQFYMPVSCLDSLLLKREEQKKNQILLSKSIKSQVVDADHLFYSQMLMAHGIGENDLVEVLANISWVDMILELLKVYGKSKMLLALELKVTRRTLNRWLHGETVRPRMRTLGRIMRVYAAQIRQYYPELAANEPGIQPQEVLVEKCTQPAANEPLNNFSSNIKHKA